MENSSLFAVLPYVAVVLLVVGVLLRYMMASGRASLAEDVADAKAVYGGGLFWFSAFVLLAGHGVVLLSPSGVLAWNGSPARLYLLEGLRLTAGLAGTISGAALVWRHLGHSSRSRIVEALDTVFLAIVFTVFVTDVLVTVFFRWASSWAAITLAPYFASLLRGQPEVRYVAEMPFLVQLNVLATFAAIAALPFTRLSTLLVAAARGCVALISRPFGAAVSAGGEWSRKHDPGAWIWPEED